MSININIVNNLNTKKILNNIENALLTGITIAGNLVHGEAIKNSPVAPINGGTLRNSITLKIDENKMAAEIGSNVEYAGYVEYGQEMTPPRKPQVTGKIPYLRPALYDNSKNIQRIIKDEIRKVL